MDTVAIWLTSKLIHYPIKTVRCAIAASLGALSSTLLTVLGLNGTISFIIGFITSVLMCLVTFGGGGLFHLAKRCAVLWTVGMVLGGVMTFLLSRGTYSRIYSGASPQTESSVHLFPVAVALCSVFVWFLKRVSRKRNVRVKISFEGYTVDTVGIVDSGNFLKDPISGDGVIVVSSELLPEELRNIDLADTDSLADQNLSVKIRLIPVTSVTGSKILFAVRPASVKLDGREVKCLVAMSEVEGNETKCIVPEGIM